MNILRKTGLFIKDEGTNDDDREDQESHRVDRFDNVDRVGHGDSDSNTCGVVRLGSFLDRIL